VNEKEYGLLEVRTLMFRHSTIEAYSRSGLDRSVIGWEETTLVNLVLNVLYDLVSCRATMNRVLTSCILVQAPIYKDVRLPPRHSTRLLYMSTLR